MDVDAIVTYFETLKQLGDTPLRDVTGFVIGVSYANGKATIAGGGDGESAEALLQQLEERVCWNQHDAPQPDDMAKQISAAIKASVESFEALGYEVRFVDADKASLQDIDTLVNKVMQDIGEPPTEAQESAQPTETEPPVLPSTEALFTETVPMLQSTTLVRLHNIITRELTSRQAVGVPA